MDLGLPWHRIQFAFTITYHYLFPQLTMGLTLLIVVIKFLSIRLGDQKYNELARFWARIFALNFAMGVVTGIPLEFQFGTNLNPDFSALRSARLSAILWLWKVWLFAFFSGIRPFSDYFSSGKNVSVPGDRLATAVALFLGSWLSGYFVIVANAFMQHPVGYEMGEDGILHLADWTAYLFNPWACWQYAHNMMASVVTASFVMASAGSYWMLMGQHAGASCRICLP